MIFTFYSYKGGVGRTMALANVAVLFYQAGLKVLMIDWDLEAPGLERFFFTSEHMDEILSKPGLMDMLRGYKELMAQEWHTADTEDESSPFTPVNQFIQSIYSDPSSGSQLWLLTAGKRSKEHFVRYAEDVLTFDWQDFYQNWEGERYIEWLRQQFEQMADVVLIDSRTGVTEIGGVCIYQLADAVVMFCSANQQSLDGTHKMLLDFKRPQVQELRGRPLDVVVVPARIENAESDFLDEFQREFLNRFARHAPQVLGASSDRLWRLAIPYIPRYAYKETVPVREEAKASSEEMVEAFTRLAFAISRLASTDSPIRSALPETEIRIGDETVVGSVVGDVFVVGDKARRRQVQDVRISLPTEVTRLRIFVASPGDVLDERERLRLVVDELNRTLADSLGHSLELLDWRDVVPSMGRPEQVILDQLELDAWDIFVGILWTRFGSPTGGIHPRTGELLLSGTEEEFTLAYHSWQMTGLPQPLFYRCMRPPQLDKLDALQLQRVQQFFAQLEAEGEHPGLCQPYKTPEEFERHVRSDLTQLILSFGKQLPVEIKTALRDRISKLERREPVHVPFADREDEIDLILSSMAPAYYLLDAPAGYGKTELLRELERRFQEQGWVCAYGSAEEHSTLPALASALAQELGVSLTIGPDARRLGANLASVLKRQKEDIIAREGLALLIDLGKRPSLALKDLLEKFIPGVQDNLRNLEFFATKHDRFRVVLASRSLAGWQEVISALLPIKVLKLTPFGYEAVRDTARDYLPGHAENSIMQIAAHVMYLTGGHPGCMAHVLEMYKEIEFSPDNFLEFCSEDAQDIVWREVDNVRNDIRPGLRRTLDNLSIFRYLDYGILGRLISSGPPVLQGYDSECSLVDELTGTYLFDWEGRLLRDDITRRLLAIRLRREMGEGFFRRCRQAQTICADHLREPTNQSPEMWAIEYLFQSLQQHADTIQDSAERSRIRQVFFNEEVPKALILLAEGRNTRVERHALEQALDEDWEFRFTVNYYLRENQYSDEPYEKLQREIDSLFSNMA